MQTGPPRARWPQMERSSAASAPPIRFQQGPLWQANLACSGVSSYKSRGRPARCEWAPQWTLHETLQRGLDKSSKRQSTRLSAERPLSNTALRGSLVYRTAAQQHASDRTTSCIPCCHCRCALALLVCIGMSVIVMRCKYSYSRNARRNQAVRSECIGIPCQRAHSSHVNIIGSVVQLCHRPRYSRSQFESQLRVCSSELSFSLSLQLLSIQYI